MTDEAQLDVAIVGAGPAGLTAALYLGRFGRRFRVIDGGDSRARWIPRSHNYPGFPEGVTGPELLERLRRQAETHGAEIVEARVDALDRDGDGFALQTDAGAMRARTVLLATGVKDAPLPLPAVADAIARGLVRICPICDGYEARGGRIGVIGRDRHGRNEALFLRSYSDRVSLIHIGAPEDLAQDARDDLAAAGVKVVFTGPEAIEVGQDGIWVQSPGGAPALTLDTLYSALGVSANDTLAAGLGAVRDAEGRLVVTPHQETSVEGLYAAGDIVRGLNQLAVAVAEAAIAAVDIHNRLRSSPGASTLMIGDGRLNVVR